MAATSTLYNSTPYTLDNMALEIYQVDHNGTSTTDVPLSKIKSIYKITTTALNTVGASDGTAIVSGGVGQGTFSIRSNVNAIVLVQVEGWTS